MKRNVIISGIAVLAVSTGIISYMVSATPQSTPEPQQSHVETVTSPKVNEEPKQSTEAPVEPVTVESVETTEVSTPERVESIPSITREEVSSIVVTTVSANWNPKETGIMISNANISELILKTFDKSPEAFSPSSTEQIVLTCIDKLKAMPKEEAVRFVYGDSCL